ncbi:MAG TPA: glycosyltransferase family 2 protein [Pyrinomonadaceae bacterium]|jgi:glycosyltransferase involved in cell wall biosynthesis|nr:glycosyltransferase family 2 protein [Pyrinomonadaceae bacterium]
MLRVRNEARWIERVVRSIQLVCDNVFVLDDNSEDETALLCRQLGCEVFASPFEDIHEARDKDYLLAKVWASGARLGDTCLMVDGDEALHPDDAPAVVKAVDAKVVCGSTHIVYLWDNEQQIRVDRWYKAFRRPSLFRLVSPLLTFKRTAFGGNFHCSSAPAQLLASVTPLAVRLLHYGYMHREDRIRKFHWYNSVDPNNVFEDQYRHMVVGDLFPADSSFKWAGPLEVVPL